MPATMMHMVKALFPTLNNPLKANPLETNPVLQIIEIILNFIGYGLGFVLLFMVISGDRRLLTVPDGLADSAANATREFLVSLGARKLFFKDEV